jgi:DNA-directed RNA polymerase subunit RPC12/RpoP
MKNRNGKNILIPLPERIEMENYVTCPNCKKTISNEPIIEAAAIKDYSESRSITCDCGERITYWNITAQLRK